MELRHLQYFVTVATTGGFGRAARHLNVSQSAISEQVRDLEDEVGASLIDRRQRQIRLTPQGEIFLNGAKLTLQAAERSVQAVRRSLHGELGKLTIGFFVGGNGAFFPALIRSFRRRYKDVQVSLVEMSPSEQLAALQAGTLDVGFTRQLPSTVHGHLHSERFYTERLYAVVSKDHPLSREKDINVTQLQAEQFVIAERKTSPAVFDKIIALCAECGFSPQIATTASVSSGVIALVEAGEGIAILPEGSRFLGTSEAVFVPIQGTNAAVDLVIAWSPEHATEVVRSFLTSARHFREGHR